MIDPLITHLKTKSQSAFKELYYQYYKLVYYQAYLILKNKEDAEDVSQTTFIRFWNNIDNLKNDSKINQLLSLMAKNAAIDLYRQKHRQNVLLDNDVIDSIPSNDVSYDTTLTFNDCLEEEESKIVTLKINFNYSFKEISEDTHLSIGVVEAKYYKAIQKIKKYYKEAK